MTTKIILRKPKFMRNEVLMQKYIEIADCMSKEANRTRDICEKYCFLAEVSKCLDKAAKAGGFLRRKDFLRWLEQQRTTE